MSNRDESFQSYVTFGERQLQLVELRTACSFGFPLKISHFSTCFAEQCCAMGPEPKTKGVIWGWAVGWAGWKGRWAAPIAVPPPGCRVLVFPLESLMAHVYES